MATVALKQQFEELLYRLSNYDTYEAVLTPQHIPGRRNPDHVVIYTYDANGGEGPRLDAFCVSCDEVRESYPPGERPLADCILDFADVLRRIGMGELVRPEFEGMTVDKFMQYFAGYHPPLDGSTPQERYAAYLRSDHWQATRASALERAGHRCQVCNCTGVQLDVHHRTYERLWAERPDDLIVLCHRCHELYEKNKRLPPPTNI